LFFLLGWMIQLDTAPGGQLAVEGAAILLAAWLQRSGSFLRPRQREGEP
jgi:hypothetical protein